MDGLTRLRIAVKQGIKEAGYTQKQVAGKIGITPQMLSYAIAGKAGMREERWRMVCEMLGLDYDEIMGYKAPVGQIMPAEAEEATAPDETANPTDPVENQADEGIDPRLLDNMRIVCAYVAEKIIHDIRRGGWSPDLDRLRGLLDAVCDLRDAAKNRE